MKDYKKTLSLLYSHTKSILKKSLWLFLLLDGIEFLSKWQLLKEKGTEQVQLSFSLPHQIGLIVFLLICGCLLSGHQFPGYISIYANRITYLSGLLIYSMMLSVGGAILMWGLTGILNCSIGSIFSIPYSYLHIGGLWKMVLLNLLCISSGLALGAVYYRLHIRSFILGMCMLAFIGIKCYEKYQMLAWYERIHLFSIGTISLIASPILLVITWVCLQRAPIKAYAHSWL